MRAVNQATLDLIREFEGERLTVYKDPIGLPTVGVGHLVLPEDHLHVGDVISRERSDALLRHDLRTACETVSKLVTGVLNDSQFGALVSFVFNLGTANFQKSTLLRFVNQRNWAGAAGEFGKWVKAGGKVLPGLVRRRAAERALFLKGVI